MHQYDSLLPSHQPPSFSMPTQNLINPPLQSVSSQSTVFSIVRTALILRINPSKIIISSISNSHSRGYNQHQLDSSQFRSILALKIFKEKSRSRSKAVSHTRFERLLIANGIKTRKKTQSDTSAKSRCLLRTVSPFLS